jgi:hypothetical protein
MKCIPLQQLLKEWETDSVIDTTNPQTELVRVPVLHSKYISQITAHSVSLKMKKFGYDAAMKVKLEYYSGRLNGTEELKEKGWKPFPALVNKPDMATYLNADKDLIVLKTDMIANEEAISFCTAVCKELASRTYQIRDYMQWERFISGQH